MPRTLVAVLALVAVSGFLSAGGPQRKWEYGPYCVLRIVPAEKGAPANSQPLQADPAVLAQVLGAVQCQDGKKTAALFAPAEAAALAGPLAEALALAGPGQDLELHSTWKREQGFFHSSTAVTARLFAMDGRLNLIVHDARMDFRIELNLENRLPQFNYGSRARAGEEKLSAPGAGTPRADWLVLALTAPAPVAAAALPAPAAMAPAQAAPAPVPAVMTPVAAAAPPRPARSREDRLRELKRLREQDLITETDYTKGKQEILNELAGN